MNHFRKMDPGRNPDLPEKVVVLEEGVHLVDHVPEIQSAGYGQDLFGIPEKVHYSHWSDIVSEGSNQLVAEYKIHVNMDGKEILDENHIPVRFPAIIRNNDGGTFLHDEFQV